MPVPVAPQGGWSPRRAGPGHWTVGATNPKAAAAVRASQGHRIAVSGLDGHVESG